MNMTNAVDIRIQAVSPVLIGDTGAAAGTAHTGVAAGAAAPGAPAEATAAPAAGVKPATGAKPAAKGSAKA